LEAQIIEQNANRPRGGIIQIRDGAGVHDEPLNLRRRALDERREPSWRENMELRSKKAVQWGLRHFPRMELPR
jgi:hypothetical protein